MKKANYEVLKLMNGVRNMAEIPSDSSFTPVRAEIPFLMYSHVPIPSQEYTDFDKIQAGGTIKCTFYSERQRRYITDMIH